MEPRKRLDRISKLLARACDAASADNEAEIAMMEALKLVRETPGLIEIHAIRAVDVETPRRQRPVPRPTRSQQPPPPSYYQPTSSWHFGEVRPGTRCMDCQREVDRWEQVWYNQQTRQAIHDDCIIG